MRERPEQHEARERGNRSGGLADFLFQEFRTAVADVRSKLLDEGWFGRRGPQTDGARSLAQDWAGPTVLDGQRRPSFEESWATRAPGEKEPASPGEHDLER